MHIFLYTVKLRIMIIIKPKRSNIRYMEESSVILSTTLMIPVSILSLRGIKIKGRITEIRIKAISIEKPNTW